MARRPKAPEVPQTMAEVQLLNEELERLSAAHATLTFDEMVSTAHEVEAAVINIARENVNVFCEYVLRDEATGTPLRQAPIHMEWHRLADQHKRVVMWSHVEAGKSVQVAIGRALWLLGRNPSLRIGIVSNTYGQAEKIVRTISRYVTASPELRRVFPHLQPDKEFPWTQSKLYLKREHTSKDPSIQAFGVHGAVLGARLDGLILDDVLDYENCRTKPARDDLWNWYHATLAGRLTADAFVCVIGTAFHPDDLMHRLARQEPWVYRQFPVLGATGQLNWPERWPQERIDAKRVELGPLEFARQMLCQARDDSEARFKREWIDVCLKRGEGRSPAFALRTLSPSTKTITGVDLAVQQHASADQTVLFTIQVHPNGDREVLDITAGRWAGPDILSRIIDVHRRYGSNVVVENNASQDYIVQMLQSSTAIPVRGFTTGRSKAHPEFGVEQIAIEMSAGKWIIPNIGGKMHPEVALWVDEMLYYDPRAHTGDRLMAAYFARQGIAMGEIKAETGRVNW